LRDLKVSFMGRRRLLKSEVAARINKAGRRREGVEVCSAGVGTRKPPEGGCASSVA
jgi:hypothetical protein